MSSLINYVFHFNNSTCFTSESVRWLVFGLYGQGFIPGRVRDFSLQHRVPTYSAVHLPLTQLIPGASSPETWRPWRDLSTQPHLVPRVKTVELQLWAPWSLPLVVQKNKCNVILPTTSLKPNQLIFVRQLIILIKVSTKYETNLSLWDLLYLTFNG
jgi:hypothetical protein